ncbi:MAG: cell division protein FtsA [Pseudomonadota bacterium]
MTAHPLFQAQRMMRDRREAALRRGVVAVLDIGSDKVACLILRVDPALLRAEARGGVGRLGGQGGLRVIGANATRSRGVDLGEIVAMDEAERAIRTTVQAAQKMAGERVDHVIACFSGGRPRSYGVTGTAEVEAGEVSEADIGAAMAAAELPDFGPGREAIHALPVNFTLDHRSGLTDPRGLTGLTLGVDMHMASVASFPLQNLLQCVRRCDLELSGVVLASYASGLAAMVEDELELGAACVDLGAQSTGLALFLRRQMVHADTVRLGGDHITHDICQGLGVPLATAERIKAFHGGLLATGADDRDMIEIPRAETDPGTERRQISRTELIGVIRPRMEEILEEARARLDAAGFDLMPGQRIVLTGGGSQMPGTEELATRILGRQVRLGKPLRIPGLPQAATSAQFSAAVGLALHVAQPQDECWDFEMPLDRTGARRFRRALRWFRENW